MLQVKDLNSAILSTKSPFPIMDHEKNLVLLPKGMESIYHVTSKQDCIKMSNTIREHVNTELMKSQGITHILNVAEGKGLGMVDLSAEKTPGFEYFGFKMDDNQGRNDDATYNMLIDSAKKLNGLTKIKDSKVVVNCMVGCSRSASTIIAYLILYQNVNAVEAIKIIKSQRDIKPSNEFLIHLAKLSNLHHGGAQSPEDAIPIDADQFQKDPLRQNMEENMSK